jgi:hypothetical protein
VRSLALDGARGMNLGNAERQWPGGLRELARYGSPGWTASHNEVFREAMTVL